MRLKAIELSGFKSFVDPTRIELGPGITSIVGPNGCGKSNIVDALRWVLGEHSARHLRGGVMDDLIFQGSETRPPVAVCEVELTFAVEPGQLPPPYHELEEIRVRRRLTREGGSDAFINGKLVRIKDVVDLFLDTGVSTRAYAIVEQGAIARMVTARPDERRQIFEEAAGVMKYRARRRESERKMRDTRHNLERVQDLLDEVRKQCRSLKQQASRAGRFKAMQDELAQLRAALLAQRWRQEAARVAELERRLAGLEDEERACASKLTRCEQAVAQQRQRLLAHEEQAQQAQDALRAAEQARAELQREIERKAGERRLLEERRETIRARQREVDMRLRQLADEARALQERLASRDGRALREQLQHCERELSAALKQHEQEQRRQRQLLGEFERLRHVHASAAQQRDKIERTMQRLSERIALLQRQCAEVQTDHESLSQALARAEQALQARRQALQAVQRQLTEQQRHMESCAQQRRQHADEFEASERTMRRLRGEVQELRASLESQDVSERMRAQLRNRGGIWFDEALDVPEGLESAVAAALRGRSADVRLSDEAMREPELRRELATTPLAVHVPASHAPVAHSLAAALAMQPSHPLFALFDGIRLVEHIGEALGGDTPCVSRDGWRYEPTGWFVPPAGNRMARRLARQRRLRTVEAELRRAETALAAARARMARSEQAWQQARRQGEELRAAVVDAEHGLKDAQAESARLRQQMDMLQQRRQRLEEDLRIEREELVRWRQQRDELEELDAGELRQAEARLAEQQQAMQALAQQLDRLRQRKSAAEQAWALFRQEEQNLRQQLQRLQEQQDQLAARSSEDQARLADTERQLTRLRQDAALDARLAAHEQAVEQAHRALSEVRHAAHALQQALAAEEREERRAREALRDCAERRQQAAVQLAQQQTRLQDLEQEIEMRCHCAPAALVQRVQSGSETLDALSARCQELEERLARFGPVNLLAIEEHAQAEERATFLAEQIADLERSLATLNETIARIDRTMRQRFQSVFEQTNAIFQRTFPRLFGGGKAELRLDSDDVLSAGVEVIAQPPGKRLQDIGLLSGGEKALTAVALVFSIFQIKPAPFCVLDEVDAPLDDANVDRFGRMLRELADRVQFLAISHNKITMQHADRLIGVSMPEPGVSRIVGVELESAEAR